MNKSILLAGIALVFNLNAEDVVISQNTNDAPIIGDNQVMSMDEAPMNTSPVQQIIQRDNIVKFSVTGQGVAPMNTISPAQAYALAKRAAVVDAYRLLSEKVIGVRVEGKDYIKNMIVERSQVRTYVDAMIKEAVVVDTQYKDGLCELEMELTLRGSRWYSALSQ